MLKMELNRPLMHEILENVDDCEWRLSELLIDSETDESEGNFPIKPAYQENNEVVYVQDEKRNNSLQDCDRKD